MNCERTLDYIDELLNHRDECPQDVISHTLTCARCLRRLENWNHLENILREKEVETPPIGLEEKIIESVATAPKTATYRKPLFAFAAALFLAAGLWFGYPVQDHAKPLKIEMKYNFEVLVNEPAAASVHLVGDFNGWDVQANPLVKGPDGKWALRLSLETGYYQYQILVDGTEWRLDEGNAARVEDGFGNWNSTVLL